MTSVSSVVATAVSYTNIMWQGWAGACLLNMSALYLHQSILGHILTVSLFNLLQPCPATCTLLNLSYRWSSKLSWRQIPPLSEYYHWRSFQHQHLCVMHVTPVCCPAQTLCAGSRGPGRLCGQRIFPVCTIHWLSQSVSVGVWWEQQSVIGWAAGGGPWLGIIC